MPSPFPGMDPYLEDPVFWRDFHGRLIYAISEALLDRLPGAYDTAVDEQVRLVEVPPAESGPAVAKDVLPDVSVVRRAAADGWAGTPSGEPGGAGTATMVEPVTIVVPAEREERDRWIEIRHRPDDTLVTVIEVLSPTNKNSDGAAEYRAKRRALLRQKVNLVELGLLVGGRRLEPPESLPPGDYYALVSRAAHPGVRQAYGWRVRHPLPAVPVPLKAPDADVRLNLAAAFGDAYERGRYGRRLRYGRPPVAPLAEADAAWAEGVARRPGSAAGPGGVNPQ